jgi:hypothetical protein
MPETEAKVWGSEFRRRSDATLEAPELVRAVQYRVGDSFQGKYDFLKFCGQGLSITIFSDAVIAKTDQGDVKIVDGNWILREGNNWYFSETPSFRRPTKKSHEEAGASGVDRADLSGRSSFFPIGPALLAPKSSRAIVGFELVKKTWGIRTDFPTALPRASICPSSITALPRRLRSSGTSTGTSSSTSWSKTSSAGDISAVAVRIDAEHLYIEWNDKEPEISQRDMYKRLET